MEKVYLIITICAIIMIAPMLSKIIKAPVVVIEIVLGLIAGYLGLIYENETLKLIAKFGFVYLMSFAALISINLAIINLIPFPALDGGRLLFLLIEKIKGSRISPKFANTANSIGFVLLIILMLVVTYHDIVKLL